MIWLPFLGINVFDKRTGQFKNAALSDDAAMSHTLKEDHYMKKVLTTASLVLVGAASAQAQYGPSLSPQQSGKNWSVSASLRGFYDDNFTTSPTSTESYGIEVAPSVDYNVALDTTFVGLSYRYGYRYFEEAGRADQSHQVNATISQAISSRLRLDVNNAFAVAQEPEIIEGAGLLSTLRRTDGDNISNRLDVNFTATLSDQLGAVVGYSNRYLDYDQEAGDTANGIPVTFNSRSALLDRTVHTFKTDLRWQYLPQTVGIVGYQYHMVNYNADGTDLIGSVFGALSSSSRDNDAHYVYAGVDQNFNQQLNGQVRVGARMTDFDNPASSDAKVLTW